MVRGRPHSRRPDLRPGASPPRSTGMRGHRCREASVSPVPPAHATDSPHRNGARPFEVTRPTPPVKIRPRSRATPCGPQAVPGRRWQGQPASPIVAGASYGRGRLRRRGAVPLRPGGHERDYQVTTLADDGRAWPPDAAARRHRSGFTGMGEQSSDEGLVRVALPDSSVAVPSIGRRSPPARSTAGPNRRRRRSRRRLPPHRVAHVTLSSSCRLQLPRHTPSNCERHEPARRRSPVDGMDPVEATAAPATAW